MSKVVFEYDANDMLDKRTIKLVANIDDIMLALYDIDRQLYNKVKYEDDNVDKRELIAYDNVRDIIYDTFRDYGLDFSNIINEV